MHEAEFDELYPSCLTQAKPHLSGVTPSGVHSDSQDGDGECGRVAGDGN
jgi:hypothetical protein